MGTYQKAKEGSLQTARMRYKADYIVKLVKPRGVKANETCLR